MAKQKCGAKVVLSLLEEYINLFAPLYVFVYFSSLQVVGLKVREGNSIPRLSNNFGLVFGQKFLPNALVFDDLGM